MTSSKDPEKHFPRLHIHILETQAKRWIENYPEAPVKRILLYSYSFPLEGYMPDIIQSYEPDPAIYAVVFEVDEVDKTLKMTKSELTEYENKCMCLDYDEKKFPEATYERLWFTTQPNLRRENFKNLPQEYLKLVTADFARVYKWPAKDNYLEEWRFKVKFKNAELNANIRKDGPHVVLWEPKQQAKDKPMLRPNQQDKIECQKIAEETWGKYPILDIVHMEKLPAITKIVGKQYTGHNTLRNWLKEVAPKRAKQPGKRNKETCLEQRKICEKLKIKHDFKL